jgi:acetate---CoA ligase (ADP-forming)
MSAKEPASTERDSFLRDIILRDGAVLRMRSLRLSDRDGLIELFNRCSPETVRYRFLRLIRSLPDSLLDQLVIGVDHARHVALVVIHGERDSERIVGVGRYVASEGEPALAEVSFLIEDAMQRRGIGTVLLDTLAEIARRHKIERFSADVLADNRQMLSVFRKAGYAVSSNISYGVTHLEFAIAPSKLAEARMAAQESEAERASLAAVFAPRSIAVIGAGRDPASVGGALFRNLLRWGFEGPIYPVNPAARSIAGVRAAASVAELPEVPELAIIVVPASLVLETARACASAGTRALCVISAGFSEAGSDGAARQRELLGICRASGMRLVGPNCMGIVNTSPGVRMLGTFAPVEPPHGNIAMSSQSGALGLALMAQAGELGLGVSSFVSVGNKADVSGNDLLQYWELDEATDVILLYLESFGNPRRFAQIARRVSRAKPIVAVKSGRTSAGERAAASHTAALASSDRAADALFSQTGIIRVDTLNDFFSVARLLSSQPVPHGNRIGILTNAGGPAVLAVDAAVASGLDVPALSESTRNRLRSVLPAEAAIGNPVDMIAGAGPEEYRRCLEIMCDDPDLDAILVIFIPPLLTPSSEVAQTIGELLSEREGNRSRLEKTFAAVFLDPHSRVVSIPAGSRRVPVYNFPEGAVSALSAAMRYGTWRNAPIGNRVPIEVNTDEVQAILSTHAAGGWLPHDAIERLLASAGIEVTVARLARSPEDAVTHAKAFGRPVAMKVSDSRVLHKSDVGGVLLNIRPEEAGEAYEKLKEQLGTHEIELDAASVSPMAQPGVEVLAGVTHDPVFGPLVAFGSGGVLVEILDDIVFRVLPLTDRDVSEMINGSRVARLLKGYRGMPAADVEALEELLLKLGALAESAPRIAEIDLNPVIVHRAGERLTVIDARVRLSASS